MDYEKLARIKIGIAGVGGLGSNVATSLARIGIKKFVIVDFDKVEKSNLNRQYFFLNQIGQYKVEALKSNLLSLADGLEIKSYKDRIDSANIESLFADVDILVEALDDPQDKALLVSEFLSKYPDKKLVAASGISGYDSSNTIKTKRISSNFYLVGDSKFKDDLENEIFLAPRVIIAANHQANMVLRLILDKEDA